MGFGFGGISSKTSSVKHIGRDKSSCLIYDNFNSNIEDYFIFLFEIEPDKNRLHILKKLIDDMGFKSYVMLNASGRKITAKELEKAGYNNFYSQNESDWKKFINYEGKHVKSIMTFGAAMYAVNKESDLKPMHFLAHKFVKPYYYIGHGFIGNFDCFIYPTYSLLDIYPYSRKGDFGDPCWITRWTIAQLQRMLDGNEEMPDTRDFNIHLIQTGREAENVLNNFMNSKILSWDIETNSLDFYTGKIHCLTLCNDGENGYFIPWKVIEENNLKRLWTAVLKSAEINVGSNLKFDLKWMWKNNCCQNIYQTDDTSLLAHSIHSDRPKGLKIQAFLYTIFGGYEIELDNFLKQTKIKDYSKIPNDILSKYATMDVIVTYRVFEAQLKEIRKADETYPNEKNPEWSMEKHYTQILMPTARLFTKIEFEGFYVNKPLMDSNRQKLYNIVDEQKQIIATALNVDKSYEFTSTKQLGKLLQQKGWPAIEIAKDGGFSTSDNCLTLWSRMSPDYKKVTDAISQMRSCLVFIKTFLGSGDVYNPTGWQKYLRQTPENDWKIHQSYMVMGTTTYRFIGRAPNLQQIPSHSKLAHLVTEVIMPPFEDIITVKDSEGNLIFQEKVTVEVPVGNQMIPIELLKDGDIVSNSEIIVTKERKTKYKMLTRDYAAFQTRLATIDTALDKKGNIDEGNMDPVLAGIYSPTSDMQDLHCQTAWSLFGDSANIPLYEVEDENGKIWKGDPKTKIETKRGIITFEELVETDEIIDYPS